MISVCVGVCARILRGTQMSEYIGKCGSRGVGDLEENRLTRNERQLEEAERQLKMANERIAQLEVSERRCEQPPVNNSPHSPDPQLATARSQRVAGGRGKEAEGFRRADIGAARGDGSAAGGSGSAAR